MTLYLNTQADLDRAISTLIAADPSLADIAQVAGTPALRRREPGFTGLAAIVCGQQLSTHAAAAIWKRVSDAFDPFHHDLIRNARAARLARLGLSAAKIKTLKALARELAANRLDLDTLGRQEADLAHAALTALHGIGPWTADIYLLFCLGHGDAWPGGDLAVQEAMRIGLNLESRPTPKQATVLAERWRPWRGAAAHLWWAYYHAVKRREGILPDDRTHPKPRAPARPRPPAAIAPAQAPVKAAKKPRTAKPVHRKK
ncbi:DNA-3-methyladenine glycosylase 2 family protein [[Pseudomonas] carboxydohydrogena]|uniref:DNA-3-methyladenine glycosylase II n=2 Tax=Afipia carboxydohydrogena TaxID=290 RepID=A0ABY8BQD7_AFICR|nr:DNA-3-methyladenine glycosylase 2 family protein [[Pseudomonas] carboxydohydrogena]